MVERVVLLVGFLGNRPVARFVADAVRAFPVGRQFALSRVFLVSSEDQGADLELSFYDFRVMA